MIAFCATPASHLDSGAIMRLFLMGQNPIGRARLYIMNDNGSQLRCLTERRPSASVSSPIWSPDSNQLLFRTLEGAQASYYLTTIDGSNLRRLRLPTRNSHYFSVHSWLADQRLLLELHDTATPQFTTPVAFYTMQLDGSELQYLASTEAFAGQTLNAGGKLLPKPHPDYSLYVANRDGSNQRPLTEHERVLKLSRGSTPVWSPNGEQVAFVVDADSTDWLYSVNADGTNLQRLSQIAFESPLIWSPNNRYLVFIAFSKRKYALYIADASRQQAQMLVPIEIDSAHGPRHAVMSWSADSQSVVYVHAPEDNPGQLVYRIDMQSRAQELLAGMNPEFELISDLVCGPS